MFHKSSVFTICRCYVNTNINVQQFVLTNYGYYKGLHFKIMDQSFNIARGEEILHERHFAGFPLSENMMHHLQKLLHFAKKK